MKSIEKIRDQYGKKIKIISTKWKVYETKNLYGESVCIIAPHPDDEGRIGGSISKWLIVVKVI